MPDHDALSVALGTLVSVNPDPADSADRAGATAEGSPSAICSCSTTGTSPL